ncbi:MULTISPECIES: HNH/endonuclease VII fold putative polymorphic toxin [unclassified Gilliamella]|uniref:HNH/endonuclease VII fold putative polymorphic toxin n=1 Tax=unclassified Gilliamella TaxID=2685620 RepID=UPI00226A4060|nr:MULTISPECIES: HNH/endonuclease VII fold putative polymorphic toxin [unclassified Gilliamella]
MSALAQLATGLAVASVGGDVGDVSTGIAAGKNAVENNNLAWVLRVVFGGKPITVSMSEYLVMQGFTTAQAELLLNSMTDTEKEFFEKRMKLVAEYAIEKQINELISRNNHKFDNEGYPIPEPLPPLPGYQPLDPEELGPNHTGHGGGLDNIEFPNHTGGNQIPEPLPPLPGYEPLDPAWINNALTSEEYVPPNLSPEGAGRAGAFNEAKRKSGIPVSTHPDRVVDNFDLRGKKQKGRVYEFDVKQPNGKIKTIKIREDAGGHFYGENNPQNRGPHFIDNKGNHYDY